MNFRQVVYHPKAGVVFCVIGVLESVAVGNLMATLGWIAALASALRVLEHTS